MRRYKQLIWWQALALCIFGLLVFGKSWASPTKLELRFDTRSHNHGMFLRIDGLRFVISSYRVSSESYLSGMSADEQVNQSQTDHPHNPMDMQRRRAEAVIDFYSVGGSGESGWFEYHRSTGVFVLRVPSIVVALVILGWVYMLWRWAPPRQQAGVCSSCGYPLADLPTNTCPECGATITHA